MAAPERLSQENQGPMERFVKRPVRKLLAVFGREDFGPKADRSFTAEEKFHAEHFGMDILNWRDGRGYD